MYDKVQKYRKAKLDQIKKALDKATPAD